MAALAVKNKNAITLSGSAAMIREFFHYGIHTILFQRGIYPSDTFCREMKFGMKLLVSTDKRVEKFLDPFLTALEKYMAEKCLRRMVVVISDVKTQETLERWVFEINQDQVEEENAHGVLDEKRVRAGMADVLRQITASVSFLPQMETECSFDVLMGVKRGTKTDEVGLETIQDLKIQNSETVQLRSFTTGHHKVQSAVEYKADF